MEWASRNPGGSPTSVVSNRPTIRSLVICLDIYGRLFEEFDPARRRPAVDVIEEARRAVRDGAVPTEYPGGLRGDDAPGPAAAGNAH